MKKKRIIAIVFVIYLFVWIVGNIYSSFTRQYPTPWRTPVRGSLPDGGYVIFQSRGINTTETDDRLTWIETNGKRHDFWVDRVHAGYGYVVIKINEDGTGVWVEDHSRSLKSNKIGASLDLTTGDFREEFAPKHKWAKLDKGRIIAQGKTYTWTIWEVLRPW